MTDLRCHHCTHWLRDTDQPLAFWGMFRPTPGRRVYVGPGATYRCKGCGWVNVFRRTERDWRDGIELKAS